MNRLLSVLCSLCFAAIVIADEPVERLYQHIDIRRAPSFVVQGLAIKQQIHYQVFSSLDLFAPDEHGLRKALQTVETTELIEADLMSRGMFTQALGELRGRQFTYFINQAGEVVSMSGFTNDSKVEEVDSPESKSVLVSTVIDQDGWKEIAQLTFFEPRKTERIGKPFIRKSTHDWGNLGSWYGRTNYRGRSQGRNLQRFEYTHELEYRPPTPQDTVPSSKLPFSIENAKFRLYHARGEILFDTKRRWVTDVTETFHAKGTVATSMMGVDSTVHLEEQQIFTIKLTDRRDVKTMSAEKRR
ncbi:hypothetical protein [Rubripirellula reticaptiva]|uniref:Uncharacterized protein n=1 Tax=Rubripirellula reticaptiva TaxID=2528013 RepID=A0A5C6EWK5_9BACT|nr:hypothetical protein [Rubripirellula reticaptiva]TWU51621.1 hypothetical protein Poly59_32150 [Rubripirellula reticaptiva]